MNRLWVGAVATVMLVFTGGCAGETPKTEGAQSASSTPRPVTQLQPNATINQRPAIIVGTVTGATRCLIDEAKVSCVADSEPTPGFHGFPQAPVVGEAGGNIHAEIAELTASGVFGWNNNGPEDPYVLGANDKRNDSILQYGQTYSAVGWTIRPAEDGTTITNDRTGHSMFVAVDNAKVTSS